MDATEKRMLMKKALDTLGEEFQIMLLVEECGELLQAIGKVYRNKHGSIENMQEEIADVQLMLDQVKLIYDEDEIDRIMDQKLIRLKTRLENSSAEDGHK
jgi:NTP pyrophosphatase (non-canonical NTP hydrolase)